jgi:hypothetical protein
MSQAIHTQISAEVSIPSTFLDGVKNAEDFRDYGPNPAPRSKSCTGSITPIRH